MYFFPVLEVGIATGVAAETIAGVRVVAIVGVAVEVEIAAERKVVVIAEIGTNDDRAAGIAGNVTTARRDPGAEIEEKDPGRKVETVRRIVRREVGGKWGKQSRNFRCYDYAGVVYSFFPQQCFFQLLLFSETLLRRAWVELDVADYEKGG